MKRIALTILLASAICFSGCITTTAPDGTTTTSIDSNLVAAILPSVLDLANRYLDAQLQNNEAEAEARRAELESRRAMLAMLITDPDLRREVLGLIDSFLNQGADAAEAVPDAA